MQIIIKLQMEQIRLMEDKAEIDFVLQNQFVLEL